MGLVLWLVLWLVLGLVAVQQEGSRQQVGLQVLVQG